MSELDNNLLQPGRVEPVRRAERVKADQLGDRARAMTELRTLTAEGASDEAICAAWWSCVRLGCALPENLARMGRMARLRRIAQVLEALPPYKGKELEGSAPHFPQPPAPSLSQSFAVLELDQRRALQGLMDAIVANDPRMIADAAEQARLLGAYDPEIAWSRVEDAEALVKCAGELRAALRADDESGAASAWFRLIALWPGSLSAREYDAGRIAFRAWGHELRRSSPDGGLR